MVTDAGNPIGLKIGDKIRLIKMYDTGGQNLFEPGKVYIIEPWGPYQALCVKGKDGEIWNIAHGLWELARQPDWDEDE